MVPDLPSERTPLARSARTALRPLMVRMKRIFRPPCTRGSLNLQKGVRGLIYRPGLENWNIGLYKKFPIKRAKTGSSFRAEAFNAFQSSELGFTGNESQFGWNLW